MPDYNIYLHAIGTGTQTAFNPTIPWSQKANGEGSNQTQPWEQFENSVSNAENPSQLVSAGVTFARSIFPKFAAAAIIIKIGEKAIEIGKSYYTIWEESSGNYLFSTQIQNIRTVLNACLNPINTQIAWHQATLKDQIQNARKEQQRVLFGDSIINSYSNRGV